MAWHYLKKLSVPRDNAEPRESLNWGRFACLATTGVGLGFVVLAGIYLVIQLLASQQ
jgi:hypothetical protein